MQEQNTPYGYCECGCGGKTKISPVTNTAKGWIRGEPRRFVNGHNGRRHGFAYESDQETGCWNWLGSKTWNGYGQGSIDGKHFLAHRLYYEQAKGPVPEGMHLDHLCRNRGCVNPDHLEPVTNQENQRRGSHTILTVEDVRQIKRHPVYRGSGRELAEKFGVHEVTITAIRRGRIWADVA